MLRNKKILITQNSLFHFTGSEIVALELAQFLQSQNNEVIIFTWVLDEPIKSYAKQKNIKITTDDYDDQLKDFDLVWVHHQVLPQSIIESIARKKARKTKFVFYHMSAMETLFLEHPYIFDLEKRLSNLTLFVSDESQKAINRLYPSLTQVPQAILPNWAPEEYLKNTKHRQNLGKIAVVSNHVPNELREVACVLKAQNIQMNFFGLDDTVEKITPQLLQKFDAVITIGKTVQYCLVMGLPVYVYDHFGGPGYLNNENFKKVFDRNFSGRGFTKKTAKKIAKEIVENYSQTIVFQKENKIKFQQQFSISSSLEKVFEELSNRTPEIWTDEYRKYVSGAEEFTAKSIRPITIIDETARREATICDIKLNKTLNELTNTQRELSITQQKLIETQRNLAKIESSRLVKTARKIRSLPIKTRSLLQKNNNNQIFTIFSDPKIAASLSETNNLSSLYRSKIQSGDYEIELLQKRHNVSIIGLIMERNESLILDDTLSELEKIVDGFVILDDNSDDRSIDIAKSHKKCLAVIKHKIWTTGNRSSDESIHRQFLLDTARYFNPNWLFYQDADERIEGDIRKFMQKNLKNEQISGIRLSLFDAYITEGNLEPYLSGPLYNFRKMFGPERRDILMAWKNLPDVSYLFGEDAREPFNVNNDQIITKFYVQHYGKSLSIDHWEETCSYYENHFPQYAKKWRNRHGKAIHTMSDFGTKLMTWDEVKKNGGIKIN